MTHVTVNKLLAMEKSLRERLDQLNELKNQSTRETFWVKKVDAKIVDINRALFEINHTIKESNACTKIQVDLDYNSLVSAIE